MSITNCLMTSEANTEHVLGKSGILNVELVCVTESRERGREGEREGPVHVSHIISQDTAGYLFLMISAPSAFLLALTISREGKLTLINFSEKTPDSSRCFN